MPVWQPEDGSGSKPRNVVCIRCAGTVGSIYQVGFIGVRTYSFLGKVSYILPTPVCLSGPNVLREGIHRSLHPYFFNFAGADGGFQQSLFKIVSKVLNLRVNYIQYAIFETCLDKVLDRYLRDFRVAPGWNHDPVITCHDWVLFFLSFLLFWTFRDNKARVHKFFKNLGTSSELEAWGLHEANSALRTNRS